jgi:transcriptional regulator with XRE-family HTH domain
VHLPLDHAHPFAQIGARLVLLRRYMGGNRMTARSWADRHGFLDSQLSSWETGARRIPVDKAEALADRYGVTLDWIYRGRLDGLSEILRKIL